MANEVTKFMWYMFNVWNEIEAKRLFGENLGMHIYKKWQDNRRDSLYWYALLDNDCRKTLVDRSNEYYKGK